MIIKNVIWNNKANQNKANYVLCTRRRAVNCVYVCA